MKSYSNKEKETVKQTIQSLITRCEKAQIKFSKGTSQHMLLRNRIHALYVAKALLSDDKQISQYTKEDLDKAQAPLLSILHKCNKAQEKYEEGTLQYRRYIAMIIAMEVVISLLNDDQNKIR